MALRDANYVIDVISEILDEIVTESENESHPEESYYGESLSLFLSKKPPVISINQYLRRIMKYSKLEPSTIVLSLIYIDRVCEISNVQLTPYNIHRLLLACLVISIKYNEDDYYSNEYYAKVGGISLKELNVLEYTILIILNFELFIDNELYENYENQIKEYEKV